MASHTASIPQELKQSLRKFRFKRTKATSAIICKVNRPKLIVEEVEQLTDVDIDELAEDLPSNQPRFIVISYERKHEDGRVSFPLVLIDWVPEGAETGLLTLHASAYNEFQAAADVSKVIQVRDGAEGLSKEIIDSKF